MRLRVRQFFQSGTAVISRALAEPGELTQGLCSPWQNDFRECSCYYWAASRPDYVDYADSRLIDYDDLKRPARAQPGLVPTAQ
jgi:hypothetical protein